MVDRFDEHFFLIAKETGGIEGLLNSLFSFLLRRTDYYYECDPGDKMGFPPGVALNMLGNIFKKYQDEHYKVHKKKSAQEYNQKLEIYQKKQKELQEKLKEQEEQQKQTQIQEQQQKQNQQNESQGQKDVKIKQEQNQQKNESFTHKQKIDPYINTYNGGQTEKYSWSQSGNDVVVTMKVPEGSNKKNIKVIITANTLTVKVKDQVVVDGKLYDKVKSDESVWSIEENLLTITLEKGQENIWKTVIQGDQEIDATKVENTKPLEDFDSETQGAIRKIMYDQQRKQQGLPTTEEEQQLEILKKAWDAEGSPFKGQPFDPSKFNLNNGQIQF
ncbi:unnamed protein product [Paramecium primaurelia]|uniref:Nuclear migration protein nudC n=1 Tax=Paramecium primaurelia TaxID=5886 RepID=A0A8S1NIH4_PARPR|nr:unnamed protein product [Paramecium primaurelia]